MPGTEGWGVQIRMRNGKGSFWKRIGHPIALMVTAGSGIWLDRNRSVRINHKAILRLMNKIGIHSIVRKRRPYTKFRQEYCHFYKNNLQRDFGTSSLNQKWCTDIIYIPTKQSWSYLSVIKDLYDGFIVSYALRKTNTVSLVLQNLGQALANEKIGDDLILHSDQKYQYSSHAYYVLTQEYSIIPSMSRRANCWNNAPAESFFRCLKEECIRQFPVSEFEEVQKIIADYIYFYNYERIPLESRQRPFEVRCLSL